MLIQNIKPYYFQNITTNKNNKEKQNNFAKNQCLKNTRLISYPAGYDISFGAVLRVSLADNSFSSRKSSDLEPENPLNKYKPNKPFRESFDHYGSFWNTNFGKSPLISPWKLHIYSDNVKDYHKLIDTIGPYLTDKGVSWKTVCDDAHLEKLSSGSLQKGKAFTIYPSSNQEMAETACDLDYIIRNNNLQLNSSSITGDREMGSTGRIFYRYQYSTGRVKNLFFDISTRSGQNDYHFYYDANRGENQYLADDMTDEDDIWLCFDPSKRSNAAAYKAVSGGRKAEAQAVFQILEGKELSPITGDETILLSGHKQVSLLHPDIADGLAGLEEGGIYKIGRSPDCDFVIEGDNTISRNHVNIHKKNGRLYIQDLSLNGTSVKIDTQNRRQGSQMQRLEKNKFYPITGDETILLSGHEQVDLLYPDIADGLAVLEEGGIYKIGRSPDCDFVIEGDNTISRNHVNIHKKNGRLYIQDLSLNGTQMRMYGED